MLSAGLAAHILFVLTLLGSTHGPFYRSKLRFMMGQTSVALKQQVFVPDELLSSVLLQ